MGTGITGQNNRDEAYPQQPRTGQTGSTALKNHQQGAITATTGLSTGSYLMILVIAVEVSGNFLTNNPFSYNATPLDAQVSTVWRLNRRTGAFLVNGVAATPGFTLFPASITGGVETTLMTTPTGGLTATNDTVDLGALDLSGEAIGSLVGYEVLLFSAPATSVSFPTATPTLPWGQFSVQEVL
jgi:hypothetical protein